MSSSDRTEHGTADRSQHAFTVPKETRDRYPNYLVREARVPIGDDYVIEQDPGGTLFVVDGKLLRIRESLTIRDTQGAEVYHIQGTLLGVKNVLALSRAGATIATVRKQAPESGQEQYVVELPGSEHVEVIGSPADRAYSLNYRGYTVATIAHRRMPLGSGYRVQIAPQQDDGVVLAVTVCLDVMSRPSRPSRP
jgi:uncharacterized protein YxjI